MPTRLPRHLITDVLEIVALLLLICAMALISGNVVVLWAGGELAPVAWLWPARLGAAGVLLMGASALVVGRARRSA